jgi:cell division protein FtsQ
MIRKTVKLRGARVLPVKPERKPFAERLSAAMPMLLGGVALLALIGTVIYLPGTLDEYPIRSVGVEGVKDDRRQAEVRMALSGLVADENFFTVPLAEVFRTARSLEWVADVQVRRSWPDKLVLLIEEREPVAVWNDDLLVSTAGEPFRALKQYSVDGLPRLHGPAERLSAVMDYYHSMSKVLAPVGLQIRRLNVDARLTARLELDNNVTLVVDRHQYARKLRRFVRMYEGVLSADERGLARVDLRYADGMAVQWRQTPPSTDKRV